jgi:hypothetical protein
MSIQLGLIDAIGDALRRVTHNHSQDNFLNSGNALRERANLSNRGEQKTLLQVTQAQISDDEELPDQRGARQRVVAREAGNADETHNG